MALIRDHVACLSLFLLIGRWYEAPCVTHALSCVSFLVEENARREPLLDHFYHRRRLHDVVDVPRRRRHRLPDVATAIGDDDVKRLEARRQQHRTTLEGEFWHGCVCV